MSKTRLFAAALTTALGLPVVLFAGPKMSMGGGHAAPAVHHNPAPVHHAATPAPVHHQPAPQVHQPVHQPAPLHYPSTPQVHRPMTPTLPTHQPTMPSAPHVNIYNPTPSTPHVNIYNPPTTSRGHLPMVPQYPTPPVVVNVPSTPFYPVPVISTRGQSYPPVIVASTPAPQYPPTIYVTPSTTRGGQTPPVVVVEQPPVTPPVVVVANPPQTPPVVVVNAPPADPTITLVDILTTLQGLVDAGNLTPDAQAAVTDELNGGLLTPEERQAIIDDINNNPNLTPADRATLIGLLQADAQEKRDQLIALLSAIGGGGDAGAGTVDPGVVVASDPGPAPGQDATPVADATPPAPEMGMFIDDLVAGGAAKKADLRKQDVIYSVNGQRTRNYDEFRAAVQSATGPTDVVFYNAETKKYETLKATPQQGMLGAVVHEVTLPTPQQ